MFSSAFLRRIIALLVVLFCEQVSSSALAYDFDNDGDIGTDADIEAFFSCLGGSCCSNCRTTDINGDGVSGTDDDIAAFFILLSGGVLPASEIATITPGRGFSAAESPLPAVGVAGMFGYDAKAIARWNVVPFQAFSDDFNVGLVAFHVNGIDRVEFSANGGPWLEVRNPQLNPQTNVREYTARLRSQDFAPSASVEIRAREIPSVAGIPRVLAGEFRRETANLGEHSLMLTANPPPTISRYVSLTGSDTAGDGSRARPYQSIGRAAYSIQQAQGRNADGGTIYLEAGDHTYGTYSWGMDTSTENRWLTITRASGLSRDQVRLVRTGISSSGHQVGIYTKLVRLQGLTVAYLNASDPILLTGGADLDDYIWFDNVRAEGPGRYTYHNWSGGWSGAFITGSQFRNAIDGPVGLLVRDTEAFEMGQDGFSGSQLVVNSRAWSLVQIYPFHSDMFQIYSDATTRNIIIYGTIFAGDNNGQGLFIAPNSGSVDGIAVVDSVFDNQSLMNDPDGSTGAYGYCFQAAAQMNHVYIRNTTFVGAAAWRTDSPVYRAANVVIENSRFPSHRFNKPSPDDSSPLLGVSPLTNVLYR